MPHPRSRELKSYFLKQMKAWPVLCLLGPRQCGKTTFLRDLIWSPGQFSFRSLDRAVERRLAEQSPELFLAGVEKYPLVVDEAQKAPALFDEIKASVDEKRIPGRFVLSGSVNFGRKVGIRESLTGRSVTVRMDTLAISEALSGTSTLPSLKDVLRHLHRGGMPGICFLREESQRIDAWEQWLDTTCERDIKIFSKGRLSSDLSRALLEALAVVELPDIATLAQELRVDARRIRTHLEALQDLFILRTVEPHPRAQSGKTLYFIFDAGLAFHLKAQQRRLWQVWFLSEYYHRVWNGMIEKRPLQYYRSRRGSFIDFVVQETLLLYSELPSPDRGILMTAESALKVFPESKIFLHAPTDLAPRKLKPGLMLSGWPHFPGSIS